MYRSRQFKKCNMADRSTQLWCAKCACEEPEHDNLDSAGCKPSSFDCAYRMWSSID